MISGMPKGLRMGNTMLYPPLTRHSLGERRTFTEGESLAEPSPSFLAHQEVRPPSTFCGILAG